MKTHIQNVFFSIWVFFHEHSGITGLQGKGDGISLTSHYHFHPFHRHLNISWVITAESSPLRIASSQTRTGKPLVSERKSLTTKLQMCVRSVNGSEQLSYWCSDTFIFLEFSSLLNVIPVSNSFLSYTLLSI